MCVQKGQFRWETSSCRDPDLRLEEFGEGLPPPMCGWEAPASGRCFGARWCNGERVSSSSSSSGPNCQTNINECASNPCLNQGTCIDDVAGYQCICLPPYAGERVGTAKRADSSMAQWM